MLVLTRRCSEFIEIKHKPTGEVMRVYLISLRRTQARIGIQASKDFDIVREELIPASKNNGNIC